MEEADFDIIVVGAGCAGLAAAYVAAKKGKSVLLVERGDYAGAKNMTGGRLYTHSLRSVFSEYDAAFDFESSVPFERKITHERICLLDTQAGTTVDFTSDALGKSENDSYSVMRAVFDQWFQEQAEAAGAEVICGIPVEKLLVDDSGAVYGIKAGDDEISAHVVIDAEGVNSFLSERYLKTKRPEPHQMAVGIKELFELPAETIESRFLCNPSEGAAMLYAGDSTHGYAGGGFLYTNKESISLGLVATIGGLEEADTTIYQMMDDFKHHPVVAPIIAGARMVEHSGHMVSEGGYDMVPEYVYDGALIAGDAAMLCMNLGYMVRGMDFAIASGRYAAEAACEGIDAGNTSKAGLSSYRQKMESSFVMKDLQTFSRWPGLMDSWDSMFSAYPKMATEVFNAMFVVDGTPQMHLTKRIMPIVKQYGMFKLLGEMRGALKAL